MAVDNKKKYLISKGYSEEVLDFTCKAGVTKHLAWFSQQLKRANLTLNDELFDKIKKANYYLEYIGKNVFTNLDECIEYALLFEKTKKEEESRVLYRFKNNFYISYLNHKECFTESSIMSNCVSGYAYSIKNKETAILALKNKSGKTLVHFQIGKNGMLLQHFEKANTPIKNENWKCIFEFFKNNCKNFKKREFGDFEVKWVTRINPDFSISLECILPKSVVASIIAGGVKKQVNDYITLKIFNYHIESDINIFFGNPKSKDETILNFNILEKEFSKYIQNIRKQLDEINGYELFLSDNMKEKIFGKKFLMKGDEYDFSETFQTSGFLAAPIALEGVGNLEYNRAVLMQDPQPQEEQVDAGGVEQIHIHNVRDEIIDEYVGEVICEKNQEDYDLREAIEIDERF